MRDRATRSSAFLLAALAALLATGCTAQPDRAEPAAEPVETSVSTTSIAPFLMFPSGAEEAMTFYVSLFPDARVVSVQRWGPGEPGPEGAVKLAVFELGGRAFMCSENAGDHAFTFTPSLSLFVGCADEAELDRLFAALSRDGQVLMPPGDYGFSRKFAWTNDRFGVSWQLNLP